MGTCRLTPCPIEEGGLTSYQRLTSNPRHEALLREQSSSLAAELDASPHGLLDDYPGEAYSVDILPAYAVIARADDLLGTDHAAELERARRAFAGDRVDPATSLPAYRVDARTGSAIGPARGVGVSYMLVWTPPLWPDTSVVWYQRFREHFWQEGAALSGFREFARSEGAGEWLVDVDAGPVLAGYGTAASGFGLAAARAHGHAEHAYALGAEALAVAWPLPGGTLVGGRLFSSMSDAPYLGESILLFAFTRTGMPLPGLESEELGLPLFVPLLLGVVVSVGLFYLSAGVIGLGSGTRDEKRLRYPGLQIGLWAVIVLAGVVAFFAASNPLVALAVLTGAFLMPRVQRA